MKRILPLFLLVLVSIAARAETPLVAVASNMTHVMQDIADNYRAGKGRRIKLTFGSSGNFTRQIQQGAPYDIFLSAAAKYADILADGDLLARPPQPYALGRIGFFIPEGSPLYQVAGLEELFERLEFGEFRRIAIANPEHAPYGVAAEQALHNGGLWVIGDRQLLIAENAAQVAQYVLSGGADTGIIPASFAHLPMITENGRYLPIPAAWHRPITQYLVLLKRAGRNSRDFYRYLNGKEAEDVLRKSGYTIIDSD